MKIRSLHPWDVSYQKAVEIQKRLRSRLIIQTRVSKPRTIAGADAAYNNTSQTITAGVVVLRFPELTLLEQTVATIKISFPYVPGLLTFREGPAFLVAFQQLKKRPDMVIFDGQGIAHPRGMGIASHLGLWLNLPTIGCAKNLLTGNYVRPILKQGRYSPLKLVARGDLEESLQTRLRRDGKVCGVVLCTRDSVKPVFVSPGHLMGVKSAREIVLVCCRGYRLPEPIRWAHRLVERRKYLDLST